MYVQYIYYYSMLIREEDCKCRQLLYKLRARLPTTPKKMGFTGDCEAQMLLVQDA